MAARKTPTRRAAPVRAAAPTKNNGTITIRKISNGYIVRESSYNERTGRLNEKETFSAKPPTFTPGK